jgi:hypothetical protein
MYAVYSYNWLKNQHIIYSKINMGQTIHNILGHF